MNDLISRQAAIGALDGELTITGRENAKTIRDYINGVAKKIRELPSAERRGRWTIETIHQYELAYGTTAYEPVYKCSCCGLLTESYLRLDEPIMPDDADFPKWCGNCGARMEVE